MHKKEGSPQALTPPKVNILLVDDQENNLIALEAVLAGPEYNLVKARSGPEALEQVGKHEFALVLMDVQMPEMDGFETVRKIKALEKGKDLPVIFITAVYREDPFVKKGYEVGAIDYFSKPFDPDILKHKVDLYAAFFQKIELLRERKNRIKETEEFIKTGQKLTGILESLPIGVLIADTEGRLCQINEEVARILGLQDSIEQDTYGDFLSWWEREGMALKDVQGPIHRALLTGKTTHQEQIGLTSFTGGIKSVHCSASPLRNLEGNILGVVLLIQDRTEHRAIAKDLEKKIQDMIALGFEIQGSTLR